MEKQQETIEQRLRDLLAICEERLDGYPEGHGQRSKIEEMMAEIRQKLGKNKVVY